MEGALVECVLPVKFPQQFFSGFWGRPLSLVPSVEAVCGTLRLGLPARRQQGNFIGTSAKEALTDTLWLFYSAIGTFHMTTLSRCIFKTQTPAGTEGSRPR
jgi:hypothetical protein